MYEYEWCALCKTTYFDWESIGQEMLRNINRWAHATRLLHHDGYLFSVFEELSFNRCLFWWIRHRKSNNKKLNNTETCLVAEKWRLIELPSPASKLEPENQFRIKIVTFQKLAKLDRLGCRPSGCTFASENFLFDSFLYWNRCGVDCFQQITVSYRIFITVKYFLMRYLLWFASISFYLSI